MEEIQTLNEELQATNEELEAHSRELRHLTESLDRQRSASETERARLSAVLLSVGDPIVVVDSQGTAMLSNPAYDRIFGRGSSSFLALDSSGRLLPSSE